MSGIIVSAPSLRESPAQSFYILSLKWSPCEGNLMWWGPNNCGYRTDLNEAGIYTAAQVTAAPTYYDNGEATLAVPCECAVQMAAARLLVSGARSTVLSLRRAASRARVKRRLAASAAGEASTGNARDGAAPQNPGDA